MDYVEEDNIVIDILLSSGFWMINKYMMKTLQPNAASVLGVLVEGYKLFVENGDCSDGWFFQTAESIEEITGLKRSKQQSSIDTLLAVKFIEQKNAGLPRRRYFRLLKKNIKEAMENKYKYEFFRGEDKIWRAKVTNNKHNSQYVENLQTGLLENNKLDCMKPTNTYKEHIDKEHIDKDCISKDIQSQGSSELDLGKLNKIISPTEYKTLSSYLHVWKERKKIEGVKTPRFGVAHKIKDQNLNQSKTIWNMNTYLQMCLEKGVLNFYDYIEKQLDPTWMKAKGITKERVQSSTVTLKEALRTHLNKLHEGAEREDFRALPNSFESFFVQRQKNLDDNSEIITSWLLYWVCKPAVIAERLKEKEEKITPREYLEENHPYNKYKRFYTSFDKLFTVGKLPENSEGVTNLVHAYTEKFKALYDLTNSGVYDISKFMSQYFPDFLKETLAYMDPNPKSYMPGRKTWNNFMDYLISKQSSGKKYFNQMKMEVQGSNWDQNTL